MSSRWLFSAPVDVAVFAGSVAVSAALAVAAPALGIAAETPAWAWLLVVVGVDVAHVWSTLFRVYLDGDELRRRPALYASAPVVAFALGVAAHAVSPAFFWRALAYVAAWHFVRQQVGWVVLYGRRAKSPEWVVRFDRAAVYAATLGPLAWWHAHLPRPFWWFREGDFIPGLPEAVGTGALVLHAVVLVAWLATMAWRRQLHAGKLLLLGATWVAWYGGIVLATTDFTFTVMNVLLHGVPYLALLYVYARGRAREGGYRRPLTSLLLRVGAPVFLGLLLVLAFLEEAAWDLLVWHEHPMFFGAGGVELSDALLTLVVPLLSVPQVTHYLLDGFVWRTRDDPSLPARLGWSAGPTGVVR
ncbi:MAG: hypothetical protein AB1730_04665 [Myxococcota bacterium]